MVDQSRWRFVVTDLAGNPGATGGLVSNAGGKQYSDHLNLGRTAQFTTNIDNPAANFILTHDCLLKVYRQTRISKTWQRLMVGDIISADESAQGDQGLLTVVAADPWWRLQRRFVGLGEDSIGRGTGYTDGTAAAQVDYSVLLKNVIVNINNTYNTGLAIGTVTNCGANSYVGPVYAQNAGDLIQQFCNALGGPTFQIVPLEPSGAMPNTIIGQINVLAALGTNKPNCVFEYGTGQRNVATYDRVLTKDGLCNKAYSLPQGFPDSNARGDGLIWATDTTSQTSTGLYEDIVQGDLATQSLRQILANEYVAVRKYARQQITFTPTVDCPLDYGVDYSVGDVCTARAYVSGGYRYNGQARLYGLDMAIDDNDAETPVLTLIPGTA